LIAVCLFANTKQGVGISPKVESNKRRIMQTQTALEPKSQTTSTSPFIVEAEKLLNRMQELSHNIARRA
jgi:hypothetical protein